MSTTYAPNGTIPTPRVGAGTRYTILSTTNTSPIEVTFASTTGIVTGDLVEIEGHLVNTAANGQWQVTSTNASIITLNGSTGNGVGGQTGYATDYSVQPVFTLPADGELVTAASVNAPIQGAVNTIPFHYRRAGLCRLYEIYPKDMSQGVSTAWLNFTSASTTFAAVTPVGASGPGLFGNVGGTNPAPPAIQAGDFFEISLNLQAACTTGSQQILLSLGISFNGGSYTAIAPSALIFYDNFNSSMAMGSMAFATRPFTGPSSYFDIAIMAASVTGASANLQALGAAQLLIKHWRGN